MIVWPPSLIREIAERRCVLFLGAGVSASAQTHHGRRPPTWPGFLAEASSLVRDPDQHEEVKELIETRRLLLALQAIYNVANPADYHDLLDRHFVRPRYLPSALHEVIYRLDSRIVITTNFDKIYETYCLNTSTEGYKVITYDSESLADDLRSDIRLIIKAHGTIDDYRRMVFTREKYHQMKRDHARFYEILKAIFITHTCVFIGCGMDDPDVLLLLEDVRLVGSGRRPHYALVREGEQNFFTKQDWDKTYNICAIEYGPDHGDLVIDLENLFVEVESLRKTING